MLCRAGGVGGDARPRAKGGSDCGSLVCAHVPCLAVTEESLVSISNEFTVILYVRIRISEDPDFRTPSDRRAVCVSVCARRRRAKVGILGNSNSYVQNNCKFI